MPSHTRTTSDIVAELNEAARSGQWQLFALAVAFPENTELLFAHDSEKRVKLTRLVQLGGVPVGWVALSRAEGRKRRKRSKVSMRAFVEFEEDEAVCDYLEVIGAELVRSLETLGIGKVVRGEN